MAPDGADQSGAGEMPKGGFGQDGSDSNSSTGQSNFGKHGMRGMSPERNSGSDGSSQENLPDAASGATEKAGKGSKTSVDNTATTTDAESENGFVLTATTTDSTTATLTKGGFGGMAGGGMFEAEEGVSIVINGGTLKINADGDGIDSNGDLTINGGSIIVYGPENSGNSAIDYNGTGVITGGEILTTGMSGRMADTFSEGSTQSYIVYYTTSTEDAGTSIEIVDADGNTIYEDDGTEKKFNMVIYSSDDLKTGNTYTVKVGDSSESVEISDIENTIGTASQDTMGGGMRNHFN